MVDFSQVEGAYCGEQGLYVGPKGSEILVAGPTGTLAQSVIAANGDTLAVTQALHANRIIA